MNPTEAAQLLAIAAAFDNRKPDPTAVQAWTMALDGIRFEDARDAIVNYYKRSREWLMPSDVRAGVKALRERRLMEHPLPDPPPECDDPALYQQWFIETRTAIGDGREPTWVAPEGTRELPAVDVVKVVPSAPVRDKLNPSVLAQVRDELAQRGIR